MQTNNMFSCSNYRAKKDQPACRSVFTVKVSEPITTEQKLANLEYFLLEFGTYTSEKLSAAFFDKTPQPDIKDLLSNSFNTDFDLSELFSH